MPNLPQLCLRYLAWVVGLRVLHIVGVQMLGLPNTLGTVVILASVPAVDIGMQALRRAGTMPPFQAWVILALSLFGSFMAVQIGMAALSSLENVRAMLSIPAMVVWLATLAMIALFLWIGVRQEQRRGA